MWCRVLLFVVAITCTFQREITAETDDVLCVVILSGLQKDDLDVNLLEKLKRHNVNVDDINNRNNIEKCVLRSGLAKSKENGTDESVAVTKIERSEQNQTQINRHYNESVQVEDVTKKNEKPVMFRLGKDQDVESDLTQKAENIIKLWIIVNTTSDQDNTSKSNQGDTLPQDIMQMLRNNNINHKQTPVSHESLQTQSEASKNKINQSVNEVWRVPKVVKNNESESNLITSDIEKKIGQTLLQKTNFEKFIKMWMQFNETNQQDNQVRNNNEMEKSMTVKLPITYESYDRQTEIIPQVTELDFIQNILSNYLIHQTDFANPPTTTQKPFDVVSKLIDKYLNSNSQYKNFTDRGLNKIFNTKNVNTNNFDKNNSISRQLVRQVKLSERSLEDVKQKKNNLRVVKATSNLDDKGPDIKHNDTNSESQTKYLEMLKAYIAVKHSQSTTLKPTTEPKQIDKLLQEIKEFIENDDSKYHGTEDVSNFLQSKHNKEHKPYNTYDRELLGYKSTLLESDHDLLKENQPTVKGTKHEPLNNSQMKISDNKHSQQELNTSTKEYETDIHSKELSHIFRMFESYIAKRNTESLTYVTTPNPNHVDTIAQKVKAYLDNNNNKYRRVKEIPKPVNGSINAPHIYTIDDKLLSTRKIDYMKEVLKQAENMKKTDSFEIVSKSLQFIDDSQTQNATKANIHQKHKYVDKNNNSTSKQLSDELIKGIIEKVKASVLEDLQKQMSTTLQSVTKEAATSILTTNKVVDKVDTTNTTPNNFKNPVQNFNQITPKTITGVSSISRALLKNDQTKFNNTLSNAFESFLELFEQFTQVKDTFKKSNRHSLNQRGKTKNEFHGPINVVYPSLLPLNYANISNAPASHPLFFNPYGFNINNPMITKTKVTNKIKPMDYTVDPYKEKKKIGHAVHAAVIQTDDVQVPLLGIPVSKSVRPINQNIIVTTKHPMAQYRDEHEYRSDMKMKKPSYDYIVRGRERYHTDSDTQTNIEEKQVDADIEERLNRYIAKYHSDSKLGHEGEHRHSRGKHLKQEYKTRPDWNHLLPRAKQANSPFNSYYQDYTNNMKSKSDSDAEYSQERERFHEKLERPDNWRQRERDLEASKKRLEVASRQQLPMQDLKNKKKYDDAHYFDFLKSQQKVNDLLENMLKKADKFHSVEAI